MRENIDHTFAKSRVLVAESHWRHGHTHRDELPCNLILGDPGAASRDDGIFMGESLQQERESSCCKLSPMKIPSSRLAAPGSPRMV